MEKGLSKLYVSYSFIGDIKTFKPKIKIIFFLEQLLEMIYKWAFKPLFYSFSLFLTHC